MDKRKNLFPLRFKGLTCYIQYNLCDCIRVLVWAFNRYAGTKENVTGFLISALFCNYSHTKVIEFICITSCGKCFKNGWKLINNDWLAFFYDILRNKFLFKTHGSHREQNVLNESYILFIKRKKNQNINKVINNHLYFQLYFRPSKTLLFVRSNLTITAWRPSIRWNILKTIRLLIPQVVSGSWIN